MAKRQYIYPSQDHLIEVIEASHMGLTNPGFCLLCGADADNVEPDAREYYCHSCGERGVYGAEEILMMLIA